MQKNMVYYRCKGGKGQCTVKFGVLPQFKGGKIQCTVHFIRFTKKKEGGKVQCTGKLGIFDNNDPQSIRCAADGSKHGGGKRRR